MSRIGRYLSVAAVCGLFVLFAVAGALAQDPPEPPDPAYSPPGMFEARGVSFVLTDVDGDSLSITSSDTLEVVIDYSFDALTMHITGIEGVTSVTLSLSGLSPGITYHQYVDHFANHITFVTDEAGATSFVHDVSAPHVVMIQTQPSTIYLTEKGFVPDVGIWDPVTRTGTLTQDIHETIEIVDHDITLDGNGYVSDMPGRRYGVYVHAQSNVTVKNMTINGPSFGLFAYYCNKMTVIDMEFNDVYSGVTVWGHNNTIADNVINHRVYYKSEPSVHLRYGNNTVVTSNICRGGGGIQLVDVGDTDLIGNTLEESKYGISISRSPNSTVRDNIWSGIGTGLTLNESNLSQIINNRFVSDDWGGIYLARTSSNEIRENHVEARQYALLLQDANFNTLINNEFISHDGKAPYIYRASKNIFSESPPVGGNYWNIWCPPKYPDGNGDGFVDKPFYVGDGNYDHYPLATPFQPQITEISGSVISDCGSTAGLWVRISLDGKEFNKAYTDPSGAYIFENLPTSGAGRIWLDTMPPGFNVVEPPGGYLKFQFGEVEKCDFVIRDTEAPVISPLKPIAVPTKGPPCTAVVSFLPAVSDNCKDVSGLVIERDPPLSFPFPIGVTPVSVTATDAAGNFSTSEFNITVANPTPAVTIAAPLSGVLCAVGTSVNFVGAFVDKNGGAHTALWKCNDIDIAGIVDDDARTVTASHSFETAGVYLVTLTVTDDCAGVGTANTVNGLDAMVVVYDPSAGFVTGGGWIDSPLGAYAPCDTLVGKANFGFVSKYKKGATTPTGQTEFRFKVADLNFHSASYDWLVIAGAHAKYKGDGTINGEGNYGFMLTAIDGAINGNGGADKFRMKIVDKDSDAIVYDNMMGADEQANPTMALGGGSIVIHSTGGGPGAVAMDQGAFPVTPALPDRYALGQNRPNPFNPTTQIPFDLVASTHVDLVIYDAQGRVVRRLLSHPMPAGRHTIAWDGINAAGEAVSSGVYFYRIQAGGFQASKRMVLLK